MTDWWPTYAPRDFLLFAEGTYWRLFELMNAAWWPLQVATSLALAALAAAAIAGARRAGLAAGLVLAAAWLFVCEAFLAARFEPINWAVGYVRPLFLAQAGLLAVLGAALSYRSTGPRRLAGMAAVILAALYPLVGLAAGRPPVQAEVVGLAPDPTAIATLGLLLLARRGWASGLLAVVPVLWLLLSGATLLTLGASGGWVPLLAAIVCAAAALADGRPGRARTEPGREEWTGGTRR